MNDRQKRVWVGELLASLGVLTGAEYEQFGYRIVDLLQPADWNHRGTNAGGAPVGHVTDSVAAGGTLVAQYSSNATYFEGNLAKLKGDIDESIKKHAQVTTLLMLSNREMGPSATTDVQNLIDTLKRQGKGLQVIDGRKTAEFIVENLLNENFIEDISAFVPVLGRLRNEFALSHFAPTYPKYVERADIESEVSRQLLATHRCALSGISGAGKSAIASAVAASARKTHDIVAWVDASALKHLSELSAFDVRRNGQLTNIIGLMRLRNTLVVLDNVSYAIPRAEFDILQAPDSSLIVTSQLGQDGAVTVGDVDRATALAILNKDDAAGCPADIFEDVYKAVGGHPLLLGILNGLVTAESEPWEEIQQVCRDASKLENVGGRRVCDLILKGHAASLEATLAFIRWCDSSTIDELLLATVCGVSAKRHLQRRSFLSANPPGVVKIHDLVFDSITNVIATPPPPRSQELVQAVGTLIGGALVSDRPELHRLSRVHHSLLERLVKTEPSSALRYSYCLGRGAELDVALLGDIPALADDLARRAYDDSTEVAVRSVIESIEAGHTGIKWTKDSAAAVSWLQERLGAFDRLLAIGGLPETLRRDITHHFAKMLWWSGDIDGAEGVFSTLVKRYPDFAAARLQLARILAERGGQDDLVLDHAKAILEQATRSEVPITLYLSAFGLLRVHKHDKAALDVVLQYKDQFTEALDRAAALGLDLAFEVIGALASKLWYVAPSVFLEIFDALPPRFGTSVDDKQRFSWAQIHKFVGKVYLLSDPARCQTHLESARTLYESIEKPNDYNLVQFAECLILLSKFNEARSTLDQVDQSRRGEFWHQRSAQALRGHGDLAVALQHIDTALGLLKGDRFRAAFLQDRWEIRSAMGDKNSVADLRAAVACCVPGRFKDELVARLAAIETTSKP